MIKVCLRPSCANLSSDEVRRTLANFTALDIQYFSVSVIGRAPDGCCWLYELEITAQTNSGVNVEGASADLVSQLAGNQNYEVEDTAMMASSSVINSNGDQVKGNDSTVLAAAFGLLFAMLAILFL